MWFLIISIIIISLIGTLSHFLWIQNNYKKRFIIDIISFYIVIIASQYVFYYLLNINEVNYVCRYLSCVGIFILFGGYMIHTLMPAKSFLFKDPISNKYGMEGHTETFSMLKNNK